MSLSHAGEMFQTPSTTGVEAITEVTGDWFFEGPEAGSARTNGEIGTQGGAYDVSDKTDITKSAPGRVSNP